MKKEVEIITIHWEKVPFKETEEFNRAWDYGIYQVYGNHFSYGDNSLLYIGKARDNTFSQRLLNESRMHSDFNETTVYPEYVRLGWIAKSNEDVSEIEDEIFWSDYIDIAENLLISTHSPAMNSQLELKLYKIGEKYADRNILILNMGDRGNLLPEVSTLRNTYLYYNHDLPFGYKTP